MDLDEVVLAIVEIVHVAVVFFMSTRWINLPRATTVALTCGGRGAQQLEGPRELFDEELRGVAILTPPLVLSFEPPLRLNEQDELHDGLDTA